MVELNNVGKSRTLKDLREDLNDKSESKLVTRKLSMETTGFSEEQLRDYFERNIAKRVMETTVYGYRREQFSYFLMNNLSPTFWDENLLYSAIVFIFYLLRIA